MRHHDAVFASISDDAQLSRPESQADNWTRLLQSLAELPDRLHGHLLGGLRPIWEQYTHALAPDPLDNDHHHRYGWLPVLGNAGLHRHPLEQFAIDLDRRPVAEHADVIALAGATLSTDDRVLEGGTALAGVDRRFHVEELLHLVSGAAKRANWHGHHALFRGCAHRKRET